MSGKSNYVGYHFKKSIGLSSEQPQPFPSPKQAKSKRKIQTHFPPASLAQLSLCISLSLAFPNAPPLCMYPRYARRISSQKPLKRSVKNGNIQETKIGYSSLFGRYSCTLFFSFQVIYRSLPVVSPVCSERWCIVCMEMLEPRFQCLF